MLTPDPHHQDDVSREGESGPSNASRAAMGPLPHVAGEAEPSASVEATALLETVVARAESFSRKAADDLYAHLLEATQDYLIDNARFNIGSKLDAANRQARHDREAWGKAESRAAALTDTLKRLWLATTVGTDQERVAALSQAGDHLARVGALDPSAQDTSRATDLAREEPQ